VVEELQQNGKIFLTVYDRRDVSRKIKKAPMPGASSAGPGYGAGKAPSGTGMENLTPEKSGVKKQRKF